MKKIKWGIVGCGGIEVLCSGGSDGYDAIASQKVIEAAYGSSSTGKRVDL